MNGQKMSKKGKMGTQKKKAGGHKKPIGKKATGASSSKEDKANDSDDGEGTLSSVVMEMNRKKKKSGGFQSMGLDYPVYKGVIKKGYKVPTPIQRKTIPLILQGRDVVGMARTGSGKTAAFVVPLLQKLAGKRGVGGALGGVRALILTPTRELALQTLKFVRELGKFCDLKTVCILGGDAMEKQFAQMHSNPDIVVATPGRLVHLGVEMGLKLEAVQYVVFDEADRLFEMGFGEQLREILGRLPDHRQTVLFSATLPKLLVEFASAGLSDPTLVRLDVDAKIPETLKMAFFHCRPEIKDALLLHVLNTVIPKDQQTLVFAATRHHVEYIHLLLDLAGISNTYIYSQLDSTARKIHAAKFANKKAKVLVVTDLAARGIDIPLLDNVINYHFPAKSKLFVHRVGRVARAGRAGHAYSLVAGDELAYFVDLQLFLGNSMKTVADGSTGDDDWHNVIGRVPQWISDEYEAQLRRWAADSLDLKASVQVKENGYKQYLKSRPGASVESVKRVRALKGTDFGVHPLLETGGSGSKEGDDGMDDKRQSILDQMKAFRPTSTIFEVGNTSKTDSVRAVMAEKRAKHAGIIEQRSNSSSAVKDTEQGSVEDDDDDENEPVRQLGQQSSEADIDQAFGSNVVRPKATSKIFKKKKAKRKAENEDPNSATAKKPKETVKDEENYIGYVSKDHHAEAGYSLKNAFEAQASSAVLDLTGDDENQMRKKKQTMRWDAKKKKYVRAEQDDKKKIRTESGVWIPASYKSDRYAKWKERSKLANLDQETSQQQGSDGEQTEGGKRRGYAGLPKSHPAMKKAAKAVKFTKKGPRSEIQRPEQILKQREKQEKVRAKNERRTKKKGKGGGGGGRKR